MSDAELTYEAARDELRSIVQKLESGEAPLAQSLALWERGEKLATFCRQQLDDADQRIASARPDIEQ